MTVTLESLGTTRELVMPSLRQAVDALDPFTRTIVSYHLGWCDQNGVETSGGGKSIRPALVLLVSEAVCGSATPAVRGAAAVEMVHNFSLLHDDIMDRDEERRHRPTVWAVWGESAAILAGDALLSLAHEVLASDASDNAQCASGLLAEATRELIRGQVLDLSYEKRDDVSLVECIDMEAAKTGALLAACGSIGATLGGADDRAVRAFADFGAQLGLAFQLVDDLLGIWGSPQTTGKPVYSDLAARKKTMPLVWCLENGGTYGERLAGWLCDDHDHSTDDLRTAADLIERAGGRDWAMTEARACTDQALQTLTAAGVDEPYLRRFEDLARFIVDREW